MSRSIRLASVLAARAFSAREAFAQLRQKKVLPLAVAETIVAATQANHLASSKGDMSGMMEANKPGGTSRMEMK
jgi:hypothetical protein